MSKGAKNAKQAGEINIPRATGSSFSLCWHKLQLYSIMSSKMQNYSAQVEKLNQGLLEEEERK